MCGPKVFLLVECNICCICGFTYIDSFIGFVLCILYFFCICLKTLRKTSKDSFPISMFHKNSSSSLVWRKLGISKQSLLCSYVQKVSTNSIVLCCISVGVEVEVNFWKG